MIVAKSTSKVRFVVLGGIAGKLANTKLIDTLIEAGTLTFVEHVPFSDVIQTLYTSDIGINLVLPVDTAHRLAAPQKLYEYFATGLAVIAADVPTLRRIITEYQCGIVVDPYCPQEIASAILHLSQNSETRKKMGFNARHAAEKEFNWESQSQQLCLILEHLSSQKSI